MSLKPGTYFIGDPCYIIKDELWSDYCDMLQSEGMGILKFKDIELFVSSTQYGDGMYSASGIDTEFPVDAGLIGATPFEPSIVKALTESEAMRLGAIVVFNTSFSCIECDNVGTITIGHISIETGDGDEFDDNDYFYDNDDVDEDEDDDEDDGDI